MTKLKKLIVSSLATFAIVFSASICAHAQIDSLSVYDNTIYAQVSAESSRLFVAEHYEGLLSAVFFADCDDVGSVELPMKEFNEDCEYKLYLWDKESLAPVSASYELKDGRAYLENSEEAVPEYNFTGYTFNQEDNVMIVSALGDGTITGYKAGVETTYKLANNVTVLGLSDSMEDVVPGCVVLVGTNKVGSCAALELLATLGMPVDKAVFEANFGAYAPSDGSEKYLNVVTELFSKNNSTIKTLHYPDTTKLTKLYFESSSTPSCYRVGISLSGDTLLISATPKDISAYPSIFESTADYHNYLYFRYNTETNLIKELVYYCVPKNYDWTQGDDEYTGIFSLEPRVIIN